MAGEPPKFPNRLNAPKNCSQAELWDYYIRLKAAHLRLMRQYAWSAEEIDSLNSALMKCEQTMIDYRDAYETLYEKNRKVEPGSLPVPDFRPQRWLAPSDE